MRKRTAFRAAFAHRDFRFLFSAFAISSAGDWVYGVAVLAYVYEQTGSAGWVAAVSMLRLLPHALLGTFGGVIADRYERRAVLLVCDLTRALLMLCLAAAAVASSPVALAAAIVLLTATAGTPYSPALAAVTPSVVGESDLTAANAVTSVVEHTAIVVGPAVGGILLFLGSPATAFAVNAATFAVSAVLISSVRTRSRIRPEQRALPFRARVGQGIQTITKTPEIAALVGLIVGATLVYGEQFVLLVLVSKELLGTGAGGVSFLMLAVGLGGVAGAALTNRLGGDVRPRRTIAIATVLFGAPVAGLAFIRQPWMAYGAMAVAGAGTIILEVVAITLLQRSLTRDVVARVFGVLESLAVGGILVGSLVAPILVGLVGLPAALVLAGSLLPGVGLAAAPTLKKLNKRAIERMLELAPRVRLLSGLGMFQGASRQALESIAASVDEELVQPGGIVIAEGDPAGDFYVVRKGTLDVFSRGESEDAARVNVLSEGDYFGEIGLLQRIPRTATVKASSECVLYRIKGEDFLNTMNKSPSSSGTLLDGVVGRLARTHPSYAARVATESR